MSVSHPETGTTRPLPAWFDDAKLGIFIHWGPFSIPGFAPLESPEDIETPYTEYYGYYMDRPGTETARWHAEHYGDLPYEAFGEQFRAGVPLWDPDAWADLFARAGARYVVLTSKTDDGFLLWPSAIPNPHKERWQVEHDLVGELGTALRARGIRFGLYYSGIDWAFAPDHRKSELPPVPEWAPHATAQWRELIERYAPDVLWQDYGFPANGDPEALFRAYYERVPDGVVNDRFVSDHNPFDGGNDGSVHCDFATVESVLAEGESYEDVPPEQKWESCRPIGASWGFNRMDTDATYTPAGELVRELVDVVARGGNLLLNVGPTGAGAIPWHQAERLLALGEWLRRYGGAVYGTRRWDRPSGTTAEGLDVRYTASDDAVHAIVLSPHRQTALDLDVRLDAGAEVTREGRAGALRWEATDHGTRVELPEPADEEPALAVRLSPRHAVPSDQRS